MGGEIQQPTSTSPESSTKRAREREAPAEAWVRIGRQLRVPLAAFAVGSALWVALILTITPLLWLRASAVPGRTPLRVSVALLALAFAIPAAASRDPWAGARFTRLALRAPYAFLRGLLWTIQAGWAVFVFLVHPGRIARAGIALFALSPIAAVLSVAPHVDPPLLNREHLHLVGKRGGGAQAVLRDREPTSRAVDRRRAHGDPLQPRRAPQLPRH